MQNPEKTSSEYFDTRIRSIVMGMKVHNDVCFLY